MRDDASQEFVFSTFDRRRALLATIGLAMAGMSTGCSARAARADGLPLRQLGAITGNSVQDMMRFSRWLGRAQDHDLLYFNQESWKALEQSVPYIVGVGAAVLAQGRRVHWSIPAGGRQAYAEIASGARDELYLTIGHQIIDLYRSTSDRVCVRLFWEFNLPEQTLAARGGDGTWQPGLYKAAYRRIALLLRAVSDRFYFDWCPNIGMGGVAPDLCYPGDDVVEVISADVYYRAAYDRQDHRDGGAAIFQYHRAQPFGLDWLARFASARGKLVGISEWGVDDDDATIFTERMCAWLIGLGDLLSHHNYWDRNDGGVASQLSAGGLPHVGAIYRKAFA